MKTMALVLATLLALAGLTAAQGGPPAGELRIAVGALGSEAMDPSLAQASNGKLYWEFMFDYLVGATSDGELSKETGLARDWSVRHGASASTYVFLLREGVKFHNGDEVTSEDVRFSLEHFRRPRSSSSAVALLRKVIDRVETPERYKVVVHTTHPYGLLLRDLSRAEQSEGIVLPKRYILEKGEDHFARNPVGTGPYRLAKHAVGASMRFEAWDHYWRGSPRYKTVTLSISPEESTRVAMLKRGEADIVNITAKRAKEVTDAGFAIFSKSGIIAIDMHLYQNWEPGSYLADPRVREALNLAIDRESILKALFEGRGQVALSGHYGTWTLGHKPVPAYRHDPGRAKTLLAEAFPSGVSLTVNSYATPAVPDLPKVNEAVAAMWAAVGVTTKIVPMDFGAHIDMWRKGRLKNTVAAHNHDNRALLQSVFRVVHHSGSNLTLTKSTELDALIEAVEKQLDLTKMGDLQFQVAKYLRDHHYEVPIVETSALFAANSQKVPKWDLSHLHATYNFAGLVQR